MTRNIRYEFTRWIDILRYTVSLLSRFTRLSMLFPHNTYPYQDYRFSQLMSYREKDGLL